MWSFLAKILGKLGAKIGEKAAEKGAQTLLAKGAEKLGGSLLKQGAELGMDVATNAAQKKGGILGKILNVVQGTIGRNDPDYGKAIAGGYKGQLGDKAMGLFAGNLDKVQKASRYTPEIKKAVNVMSSAKPLKNMQNQGLYEILDRIKASKAGQMGQKALSGDSFGSKLFLNTLENMGRQGAFTPSDVGQPDKNFFGMLGNSLAGALGESSREQRAQNFNREQTVLNMAQDFDPSQEMMQQWQPRLLNQINGFKADLVNKMYTNRKKGLSGLTSEDMMDTQMKYVDLKKREMQFQDAVKAVQTSRQFVMQHPNDVDLEDHEMRVRYAMENGRLPGDGLMYTPAAKDPASEFPSIRITPPNQWSSPSVENGFMRTGRLTDEQRNLEAIAQLNSNPSIRKWAERNGYKVNDPKDQIRFGLEYGKYIEPPVPDEAAKMRYEDQQQREADKRDKAKEKLGYAIQGDKVVFTRDRTENILKKDLENAIGEPLSKSEDNAIPIRFENIRGDGSLTVSATVKDADNIPVLKQFVIPPSKARDLVEPFFPGAYGEATKLYKAPKEPTGVERQYELQGYGRFTAKELKAKGWTDEQIKQLD